jgi:uncharacterized membrane protein YeaQ/YmgE (transglycosylase-associated protein family)
MTLTFGTIVTWVLVGAVTGWLATQLMGRGSMGFVSNTIIGIVGGILGNYLLAFFKIAPPGGLFGTLVTPVVGAMLLLFVLNLTRFGKK